MSCIEVNSAEKGRLNGKHDQSRINSLCVRDHICARGPALSALTQINIP